MVKKDISDKGIGVRIMELKIELLKQPTKKKSIKKEIAKLLTRQNNLNKQGEEK